MTFRWNEHLLSSECMCQQCSGYRLDSRQIKKFRMGVQGDQGKSLRKSKKTVDKVSMDMLAK